MENKTLFNQYAVLIPVIISLVRTTVSLLSIRLMTDAAQGFKGREI